MIWNIFQWRSLKTRVTLFTLAIFVISIWSLSFYVSRILREDMQRLLGEQQFSTVSFVAAAVNGELESRRKALEQGAGRVTRAILGNTAAMQTRLEESPILQGLFNGGTFTTGIDGIATASLPLSAERKGVDYMDRDFIVAALKEGKATVGRPVIGKQLNAAIFVMGAPIRDAQGSVIGVLSGVTNLGKPNFLDKITEGRYGKTGGYLLNAREYRLVVTASDKSRIMQPLPAPGVNKMLDRYIQGYEGYGVSANSRGVEELTAAKGIPAADWFMGVVMPTAEAFAPIREMQQRMLLATILLTLLAGGLTWWMIKRELAPLIVTVETLTAMSDTSLAPQPLPIAREDEIGKLIGGFNRLLETLREREGALESEKNKLEETLSRIKRLEGLLSICMQCKKIRTQNNDWHQLERYIGEHSDAVFSHGLCPECLDKEMKKLD